MTRIVVHIDKLVFKDFVGIEQQIIANCIQSEIKHLLGFPKFSVVPANDINIAHIRSKPINVPGSSFSTSIGSLVGQNIVMELKTWVK